MHGPSTLLTESTARLARLAIYAVLIVCLWESLVQLFNRHYWLSVAFSLPVVFCISLLRRKANKTLAKRRIALLYAITWLLVLALAWNEQLHFESVFLLVTSQFLIFNGRRILWLSIALILILQGIAVGQWPEGLYTTETWRFALMLIPSAVVIHALAAYLLEARNEAATNRKMDVLTGVWNRVALAEAMQELKELNARYHVDATALGMQVDNLTQVLSTHGEKQAGIAIRELASILSSRLRNTDRLYRYGDETFVVLLPGTPLDKAGALVSDLEKACGAYEFSERVELTVMIRASDVLQHDNWEQWIADTAYRELSS